MSRSPRIAGATRIVAGVLIGCSSIAASLTLAATSASASVTWGYSNISTTAGAIGVATFGAGTLFEVTDLGGVYEQTYSGGAWSTPARIGTTPDSSAVGVAVDPNGDLFISDGNGKVYVMEYNAGTHVYAAPALFVIVGSGTDDWGISTAASGNLFVSGLGNGELYSYHWTGSAYGPAVAVATDLSADGIFDAVLDQAGNMYVYAAGSGIYEYAPGNLDAYASKSTADVQSAAGQIGLDNLGDLVYANSPYSAVTVFTASSAFAQSVSLPVPSGSYPSEVATAPNGFYLATTAGVLYYQPQSSQSIAFTSSAPTRGTVGETYSVQASGGASGSPVVFSVDGASTAGACSLSGSVVSFTGVGTCILDANQAGTATYSAAPQAQQSFSIAAVAPTTTTTLPGTTTTAPGSTPSVGSTALSTVVIPKDSVVHSGAVHVSLACTGSPCSGTVELSVARRSGGGFTHLVLAKGSYVISTGETSEVTLAVTKTGTTVLVRSENKLGWRTTALDTFTAGKRHSSPVDVEWVKP